MTKREACNILSQAIEDSYKVKSLFKTVSGINLPMDRAFFYDLRNELKVLDKGKVNEFLEKLISVYFGPKASKKEVAEWFSNNKSLYEKEIDEVKLYGGIEKKVKSPTGYGDELAATPDQGMTGTISEDYLGTSPLEIGDQAQIYPLGEAYDGALVAFGVVTMAEEDGESYLRVCFDDDIDEENSNTWYSEKDYDIVKVDINNPEFKKRHINKVVAMHKPIHLNSVQKEDVTTADMAAFDTRIGTMKKNKQKPAYGYSYMTEDLDKKIANLEKAIAGYYERKNKALRGSPEHKICVKRIIDAESDLKKLKSKKKVEEGIDRGDSKVIASMEKFKQRPDFETIMNEFKGLCREYGIKVGTEETISSQVAKKNPIYQKEFVTLLDKLCKKYNLTHQSLGLEEGYDFSAEENEFWRKLDYDKLRQDIVLDYNLIRDSGVDKNLAIGQVASRYRQDPEYVKVLVKEAENNLKTEIMTEKEIKARKLLESYGIVTKAKAPIEEESEEEETEKDETEEDDKKEKKGPKKGVNPFAKKDKEDDKEDEESEESEEEETEEEEHEFKGAGSEVCVKGIDRETAKGLAAKLLAPFEGSVEAPVGKYKITFEPLEDEGEEEVEE